KAVAPAPVPFANTEKTIRRAREAYIEGVTVVDKMLDECRSWQDVEQAVVELAARHEGKMILGWYDTREEAQRQSHDVRWGGHQFAALANAEVSQEAAWDNRLRAMGERFRKLVRFIGQRTKGYLEARAKARFADEAGLEERTRRDATEWKLFLGGPPPPDDQAREAAWERYHAAHAAKSGAKPPRQRRASFDIARLRARGDVFRREGGEREAGTPDAERMMAELGLSGVQFGNWATDDERAAHVTAAHNAFLDLADVLGVPASAIGQRHLTDRAGDRYALALAIGARGDGRARAHYESLSVNAKDQRRQPVINITKLAGGGSVSHEWAHYLDNMGALAHLKSDYTRGGRPAFISEDPDGCQLPPKVEMAAVALMKAIRGERKRTDFYHHAEALNQGRRRSSAHSTEKDGYWTRRREMFARAFEAYAEDWLHARGRMNNYLVSKTRDPLPTGVHVEGRFGAPDGEAQPYPQGEERARINAAMERFITALREADLITKAFGGKRIRIRLVG
ncbi:MAG: hypothetical protein KC620_22030, partial [Myxococcales bacterium]|nr:hypothetical protein [Myxococcales bacterium]